MIINAAVVIGIGVKAVGSRLVTKVPFRRRMFPALKSNNFIIFYIFFKKYSLILYEI